MLLRCIKAENRKLRGAPIWLVFLVVPLISCLYGTYNFIQNSAANGGVLSANWYNLWTQHTLFYTLFFFAAMVGVYAAYLWRLEHLGHNWNTIMTVPVPPFLLFLAKFAVVAKVVLLTQIWVYALYLICGRLWARLPGYPPAEVTVWLLRGVLGSFAIIALELLVAMLVRSFAVPVLVGLAGGVSGMLFASKGWGLAWPFALMQMGMNSNKSEDTLAGALLPFLAAVTLWTGAVLAAAWLLLKKRDVRT